MKADRSVKSESQCSTNVPPGLTRTISHFNAIGFPKREDREGLATVNALATAKSLFVADPATTKGDISTFNSSTGDQQFSLISKYLRVNGAIPATVADLETLEGMQPATTTITLGTLDDSSIGGTNPDSAPTVTQS